MRFKPMKFGTSNSSIRKPYQGFAFQFSPSPSSITPAKKREDSNTGTSCNRFNVGKVSNNLKVHPVILLQTLRDKPSHQLTLLRTASGPPAVFQIHSYP